MFKLWIAAVSVAALALPGAALAEAGRQISVNGAGAASVPYGATDAQQKTAYGQALAAAIGDAQTKASMVAQQLSLKLGAVETFTEQSEEYLGYCGVGFFPAAGRSAPTAGTPVGAPTGQLTRIPPRRHKRKHVKKAHRAQTGEETCQLQADVTVVYAVS